MSIFSITTEAEEALAAATAETVLQLRGVTTTKAKIIEWGVFFDGVSATEQPVRVRVIRQTTDGTASAATEAEWDEDGPEALVTGFHSFTAEPTVGEVLADYNVHPQAGIAMQYPLGREIVLSAATTSRIGIECTAPAIVNVAAYLVWEE